MATCPYIVRRGNRYYFRIRVPADLVAAAGRSELKRSLRTSDRTEARRRASGLMVIAARLNFLARLKPMISDEAIKDLVRAFYLHQLDIDHARRIHFRDFPGAAEEHEAAVDARDATLRQLQLDCKYGRLDEVDAQARHVLVQSGHVRDYDDVDPEDPAFRELSYGLMRALLEATKCAKAIDEGILDREPTDPLFKGLRPTISFSESPSHTGSPSAAACPAPPRSDEETENEDDEDDATRNRRRRAAMTPSEYVEEFLKEIAVEKGTSDQYRYVMKVFEDLCSIKPISKYTTAHVTYFRDQLLKLPKRANEMKCGSLREAIAANESLPEAERRLPLNRRTISDGYLPYIRKLFAHAARNDIHDADIAKDVKLEATRNYRKRLQVLNARQAFSPELLQRIFEQPLFTGAKSLHRLYEEGDYFDWSWRFWVPLFMLFAGVRPGELGQAEVADIIERCGYPCLNITHISSADDIEGSRGGEDGEDEALEKGGKTLAAFREIPIHPVLLDFGFLDRVHDLKAAGERRLFPEWAASAHRYSNTTNRFFNGKGGDHPGFLARAGVKRPKTALYSLRHNFKQALKKCGFQDSEADLVMGHANPSVSAIYDSPETYALLISKMMSACHEGLDLNRAFEARGRRRNFQWVPPQIIR